MARTEERYSNRRDLSLCAPYRGRAQTPPPMLYKFESSGSTESLSEVEWETLPERRSQLAESSSRMSAPGPASRRTVQENSVDSTEQDLGGIYDHYHHSDGRISNPTPSSANGESWHTAMSDAPASSEYSGEQPLTPQPAQRRHIPDLHRPLPALPETPSRDFSRTIRRIPSEDFFDVMTEGVRRPHLEPGRTIQDQRPLKRAPSKRARGILGFLDEITCPKEILEERRRQEAEADNSIEMETVVRTKQGERIGILGFLDDLTCPKEILEERRHREAEASEGIEMETVAKRSTPSRSAHGLPGRLMRGLSKRR